MVVLHKIFHISVFKIRLSAGVISIIKHTKEVFFYYIKNFLEHLIMYHTEHFDCRYDKYILFGINAVILKFLIQLCKTTFFDFLVFFFDFCFKLLLVSRISFSAIEDEFDRLLFLFIGFSVSLLGLFSLLYLNY